MTAPWLQDADVTLYHGDVLAVLRELPAESVDCCVTSPPYWGLRDYGQEGQLGLEPTPEEYVTRMVEVFREVRRVLAAHGTVWLNLGSSYFQGESYPMREIDAAWLAAVIDGEGCIQIHQQRRPPEKNCVDSFQVDLGVGMMTPEVVQRCHEITGLGSCQQQNRGVWDWSVRGQQAAQLLRAIYPYLVGKKKQAALAIMLADDLAARKYGRGNPAQPEVMEWRAQIRQAVSDCNQRRGTDFPIVEPRPIVLGLKPKDDCMIPARVALALQADGWFLRSEIVWGKLNPMPESVTDRPTKAHEMIYLLSKQPRYFFDQEAVREKYERGVEPEGFRRGQYVHDEHHPTRGRGPDGRRKTTVQGANGSIQHRDGERWPNGGRNIRSVWEIATQPFSGRELFGGDGRIPSPDCPRHGDRPAPAPTGLRDGRADASSSRTPHSDGSPAQEPQDAHAPTELILEPDFALASSDSQHPASTAIATPSSTRTRKTSSHSDERDTDGEQTPDRTRRSEPSDGLLALDGFDSHDSSETTNRTSRKSGLLGGAYSPPGQAPHGNARDRDLPCTCKYIDHFATFPEELARRCIAAGCPEQVCRVCGKARERIVEKSIDDSRPRARQNINPPEVTIAGQGTNANGSETWGHYLKSETLGFTDCVHALAPEGRLVPSDTFGAARSDAAASAAAAGANYRPGVVLDPFIGSGTVAHVARKLGRHAIGIDLNESYLELAARRLQQQSLFAEGVA